MSKVLKVTLKESMASRLAALALLYGLSEAEIVRHALLEYFRLRDEGQNAARIRSRSGHVGPRSGHDQARRRPGSGQEAAQAESPSFSPPPFPSALPKSSPSLSPPLLTADAPLLFGDGAPEARTPPPGALLEFQCIRGRKTKETRWYLTGEQVSRWEEVFPDMDILAEAKRAREYTEAKGFKTFDGMKAYLIKWLTRSQNGGRYPRRTTSALSSGGRPTLQDTYGYSSWEEWEASLRRHLTGGDLEVEMGRLAELRRQWEEAASVA